VTAIMRLLLSSWISDVARLAARLVVWRRERAGDRRAGEAEGRAEMSLSYRGSDLIQSATGGKARIRLSEADEDWQRVLPDSDPVSGEEQS